MASLGKDYTKKSSPNYRRIKIHFAQQTKLNDGAGWPFTCRKLTKKQEDFDPCQPARTAQADMGRYFTDDTLSPPPPHTHTFTELGICILSRTM